MIGADVLQSLELAALPIPLPTDWIVQGGAVGMLGLVFLLIVLGWVVPRRTVKSIEQERDLWREVALRSLGHTETLLPAATITAQSMRALSDAAAVEQALTPTRGGDQP